MEQLERVWDLLTTGVNGALGKFERTVTSLFGSANDRYVKSLDKIVATINSLEPQLEAFSDEELQAQLRVVQQHVESSRTKPLLPAGAG